MDCELQKLRHQVLKAAMTRTWWMFAATRLLAVVSLLQPSATALGNLEKIDMNASIVLPTYYDSVSETVSTGGGFKFGTTSVLSLYVSSCGYISMGTYPPPCTLTDIPGDFSIVSPYLANIDVSIVGSVRLTDGFDGDHPRISEVSSFVESQTGASFSGTRMMVVEWDDLAKFNGSELVTSTFQAVLITDGSASYAVFIYQCGGLGWGGATIGWAYSSSIYEKNDASGTNSASIACAHNSTAIVYRLDRETVPLPSGRCHSNSSSYERYSDCRNKDGKVLETVRLVIALFTTFTVVELLVFAVVAAYCWMKKKKQLKASRPRILKTMPFKGAVGAASRRKKRSMFAQSLHRKQQPASISNVTENLMKDVHLRDDTTVPSKLECVHVVHPDLVIGCPSALTSAENM